MLEILWLEDVLSFFFFVSLETPLTKQFTCNMKDTYPFHLFTIDHLNSKINKNNKCYYYLDNAQ